MSQRIQRINEVIKEEISKILLKEIDFPREILVTVTRVDTSSDLRQAKVFISCYPEGRKQEAFSLVKKKC
ncbi:ribosome-binding factor A [Patescibacteria group bacterium]